MSQFEQNEPNFIDTIQQDLELLRDGQVILLGMTQMGSDPITAQNLLKPETASSMADRGQAYRALLRWATDKLKPGGTNRWDDRAWLNFNIVENYYWQGNKLAYIAEKSGYSDIHMAQSLRPRAVGVLASIIEDEQRNQRDLNGRRQVAVDQYIHATSDASQVVLAMLTTIGNQNKVASFELVQRLARDIDLLAVLQSLEQAHLITLTDGSIALHPLLIEFPPQPVNMLTRRDWLMSSATYYASKPDYVSAAKCYLNANMATRAADLLIGNWRQVVDSQNEADIQSLRQHINDYAQLSLPTIIHSQLLAIAGHLSEFLGDLSGARKSFEKALRTPDTSTKASVVHRLAEISKRQNNIDMALAQYTRGIQILQDDPIDNDLLTRMLVDQAMVFIQERQDLDQAHQALLKAQEIVDKSPASPTIQRTTISDLHNAWASYHYQRQNKTAELDHRLQSWLAALESQDTYRMLNSSHNLGQAYVWRQQYAEGLEYLERTRELAESAGNQQFLGSSLKSIGNIYFWQKDYGKATEHYFLAYQTFEAAENRIWLGYMCYEIAELYAIQNRFDEARPYFLQGQQIASEMGNQMLLNELSKLNQAYPQLEILLNRRQQTAVDYIRENGSITNKLYCDLVGCSPMTATRDLAECVEQSILIKVGQGRGTKYQLAGKTAN